MLKFAFMKHHILFALCLLLALGCIPAEGSTSRSVYTQRPADAEAYYFTPANYSIKADGKADVSRELQRAINQVKQEKNFGILFIPEGKYLITRTLYIPSSVRLIGYGKHRPEIILAPHAKGFDAEPAADKGKARYMLWFTSGIVNDESRIDDANAGTFYSALSNIDLRISEGNPAAIVLRTHFAQHCFVSHCTIHIGSGKAGIFDLGNELEDVQLLGGQYGIITTKASPGWQVMMTDCTFDGQRKAAIRSQESGLAIVNMVARNVPTVFVTEDNCWEKLFLENSRFENVSGPAIVNGDEDNSYNQLNLVNVACKNVPTLVRFMRSGRETKVADKAYTVRSFSHGLQMDSLTATPRYLTSADIVPGISGKAQPDLDVPALPDMAVWHNVRQLGAVGDGKADDTQALQAAIDQYDVLYLPQGQYRITAPLTMRPSTKLIGLHPFGTQLCLDESTPAFSGFGSPQPMLQTAKGGDCILNSIGINTGAYNYRAVGVKWMAEERSLINDVKFIGGHGTLWRPQPGQEQPRWRMDEPRISSPSSPVTARGKDLAWDNQHWSLWVCDGGGGTFKDIWTANTYATSGFYAEHTSTPSRIYAMSIEHHVRNEVRFNDVANWKVYCMQTEEETRESSQCQPIEMDDCHDMTFANLYMFRVIAVNTPYYSGVRLRSCRNVTFLNVHNYAQTQYPNDIAVYDQSKNLEVRPWEMARLVVTGEEASQPESRQGVKTVATDLNFARGTAHDSQGNVYFCDPLMRRVYGWSAGRGLRLIADFPWEPRCLAVDSEDHLLVLFRYDRQPGYEADRQVEIGQDMADAGGTSFSGWGNGNYAMRAYTIDPENPEETIALLPKQSMGSVVPVAKALYPSNRWRDFHDFNAIAVYRPEKCFVAPDGKTIIPHVYDLARTAALVEAIPDKTLYVANEYDARTVSLDVADDGTLSHLKYFTEAGEFCSMPDSDGNVYVLMGDLLVYSPEGKLLRTVHIPERPSTLTVYGKGRLFVTSRSRCFTVDIE